MDMRLSGRTVLVTGGSGDIGRAVVSAFAEEGAAVAVGWYGNRDGAEEAVRSVTDAGGRAMSVRIDLADPESTARAVAEVEEGLGGIGVLVANAVAWPEPGEDTWEAIVGGLTANVAGTLATVEAALPAMRSAGWGRVVVVSSDVVDQPAPWSVAYPTAKGALETAARVLAVREASHGVLTNVVRPGFTLTERALTAPWLGQETVDSEGAHTPTGRICTPEDVAAAAVFLGSGANGHINGDVVSVAGGRQLVR